MLSRAILLDLDGTLTNPKPGITCCIQYALSELGYVSPDADELLWCIGPPLKDSFLQLLKTSDDGVLNHALSLYRSRYSTVGLFENSLYPQIPEAVQTIRSAGYKTFVATSKPHIFATRIIEHFNLSSLFDGIYGSELDGTRCDKGSLIEHILQTEYLASSDVVMVSDRKHDMIGAKYNCVYAIGVTYGYGTEQELTAHGADLIANSPTDIPVLVKTINFLYKSC